MTVIANYVGQKGGEYWVNVKNANPKGMIGDAGVIRRFESEDAARNYAQNVNDTGVDSFVLNKPAENNNPVRHEGDIFVPSSK